MQTLKEYLKDRNKSDFAKQVGVSGSQLSQYLSGYRLPSYGRMLKIERLTDGEVPVQSWELVRANVDGPQDRQRDMSISTGS